MGPTTMMRKYGGPGGPDTSVGGKQEWGMGNGDYSQTKKSEALDKRVLKSDKH